MTPAAYSNANIFTNQEIRQRLSNGETREELIAAGFHRITVNRTYWRWTEEAIFASRGADWPRPNQFYLTLLAATKE